MAKVEFRTANQKFYAVHADGSYVGQFSRERRNPGRYTGIKAYTYFEGVLNVNGQRTEVKDYTLRGIKAKIIALFK